MQTLQLTNQTFILGSKTRFALSVVYGFVTLWLTTYASSFQGTVGILFLALLTYIVIGYLYQKGIVKFTLTSTHFQQHTFKGGWVVQWSNIANLGMCRSFDPTASSDIPWIGIKLKKPELFIENICPRVISEILLQQRTLLYLGAREHKDEERFQDILLDSRSITVDDFTLHGLQASLYRRMGYQRNYWGYDLFIATADLDRDPEDFIGIMRRYWAASQA